MKAKAKTTVNAKLYEAPVLLWCTIEWWAQVTAIPDASNRRVFKTGNSKGSTESIPLGGHWVPASPGGDKALCKKVQNIAKKNRASLTINNATPMFKPFCTADVWLPKYVASLIMSLNHKDIEHTNATNATLNRLTEL